MAKKQGIESKSYPIMKASFSRLGGWSYKIPDQGYVPKTEGFNRFIPKKPMDFICTYAGVTYFIEMKGYKEIKGLSFNDLREVQQDNFKIIYPNLAGSKNRALVGYYFFQPKKLKKLIFVNYSTLKSERLIPKKLVLEFLENHGDVLGENYIDPKDGKQKRRHYIPLDDIDNYII